MNYNKIIQNWKNVCPKIKFSWICVSITTDQLSWFRYHSLGKRNSFLYELRHSKSIRLVCRASVTRRTYPNMHFRFAAGVSPIWTDPILDPFLFVKWILLFLISIVGHGVPPLPPEMVRRVPQGDDGYSLQKLQRFTNKKIFCLSEFGLELRFRNEKLQVGVKCIIRVHLICFYSHVQELQA